MADLRGKIGLVLKTLRHTTIGVLDIQGSVEEHLVSLKNIGVDAVSVKTIEDLKRVDGLIMPGGESTTIGKLLKKYGLDDEIKKRVKAKTLAIWGTCAGAILLAKHVGNSRPDILGLMDIEVVRNAYGRQLESFETPIKVPVLGEKPFPSIFIRAPQINSTSPNVEILAKYGVQPIMALQDNLLVTTFHPELTNDGRVHKYFISIIQKYAVKR